MKIKYMLTVAAIVAVTKSGFAQYSGDALKFSQFQTGSTARFKGLGNAGTAIGGDLSNISGNPAGLGFFTKSELSITPEFNNAQAKSTYFAGTTNTDNKAQSNNVNFNNASAVFYTRLNKPRGEDKTKGWLSINYGISYNRTNDFYANTTYGGKNANNSLVDRFTQLANTDPTATSDGSLQNWAYNQYLFEPTTAGSALPYQSNVHANIKPVDQINTTTNTGGQTAFNFSVGANYSNQLYLGFGIGVTSLRYNSTNTFSESGHQDFDNLDYNTQYAQNQTTKGTGINATFGAIYKPVDALRLGLSVTTPTWYVIDDDYSESLKTQYVGSSYYADGPADYPLSYSLRTPLKVSGGAAVFFKNYGFITADVDYLDYSSMRLDNSSTTADGYDNNTGGYDPTQDNSDIHKLYRSTVNAHIGGEARLTSQFAIRGGYGVQGSPYVNTAYQNNIRTISGGLGYRTGLYYIDATYSNVSGSESIYPYIISSASPYANIDRTYNNVFLTLGLRF
ncbi:hypothetical protein BDD43_4629 [Mucilaginibacter gracilis]|uniref:Long-subunit fatty acid transport protein n=1 Tax=Mucilaginibacter gracilis TaxID=423350 RepID=A0A495J7Q5_9SPHI|nr:hypothetical protein [Mucilaginibacter gracilis]RKR84394.1 hypothetical protein BDD43_4629 [Mucilaginibacter gracilis]